MTRLNARAAAVLVAAAVLLPAGVAHAALPLDTSTSASKVGSSSSAADEESDDDGDDQVADDDAGSDDAVADDDSSASSADADADADDDSTDDESGAAVRSSGSAGSGSGSVAKGRTARAKAVAKPRGVAARLTAFDRAVVSFRPGSTGIMRWIVTLRAGSSGRLLILGPKARSATFTALKASTRYTATVTAVAAGGKQASATDHVRTASLKKAVAQTRSEAARAVRESKAQRFG